MQFLTSAHFSKNCKSYFPTRQITCDYGSTLLLIGANITTKWDSLALLQVGQKILHVGQVIYYKVRQ